MFPCIPNVELSQKCSVSFVTESPCNVAITYSDLPASVRVGSVESSSASVPENTLVELLMEAPSEFNKVSFVCYTLNGVQHYTYLSTRIDLDDQYLCRFQFADQQTVVRGSRYASSSFELYRLTEPITVKTPSAYDAVLFKNGVSVGSECTAFNGDTLRLECGVVQEPGVHVTIPIAVGKYVETLKYTVALPDQTVDFISFPSALGAQEGLIYESVPQTIKGLDAPVRASTPDSTLLVNGIVVDEAMVSNEDTVALRVKAGSKFAQGTLVLTGPGVQHFNFLIVTQPSDKDSKIVQFPKAGLFAPTAVAAKPSANKVGVLTGSSLVTHALTEGSSAISTDYQVVLCSPLEDRAYVLSPDCADTLKTITFAEGDKPFGIGYTYPDKPFDAERKKFITLSGSGKVAELASEDYSIVGQINVGSSPKGIACDTKGRTYVCCSDGLYVIEEGQSTATQIDFNGCYEATADGDTIYVSCLSQNTVRRYRDKQFVAEYAVGESPIGLCVIGDFLYVANSADNTVSKVNTATGVVTTIPVYSFPTYCANVDGSLAVAHAGVNCVLLFSAQEPVEIALPQPCYGMSGNLLALLYPELESRVHPAPIVWNPTSVIGVERSADIPFALPAFDKPYEIRIPGGAKLLVGIGEVETATPVTLTPEDAARSKVIVRSADDYLTTEEEYVSVGHGLYTLSVTTLSDCIPDFLDFGAVLDCVRNSAVRSIELTVSGLSDGAYSSLTLETCTFEVNGAEAGSTCYVKNGDVIALKGSAVGVYSEVCTHEIVCGELKVGQFSIGVHDLEGPVKDQRHVSGTSDSRFIKDAKYEARSPAAVRVASRDAVLPAFSARRDNSVVSRSSDRMLLDFNSMVPTQLKTTYITTRAYFFCEGPQIRIISDEREILANPTRAAVTYESSATKFILNSRINSQGISRNYQFRWVYASSEYSKKVSMRNPLFTVRNWDQHPTLYVRDVSRTWNPKPSLYVRDIRRTWKPWPAIYVRDVRRTWKPRTVKAFQDPRRTWTQIFKRNSLFAQRLSTHEWVKPYLYQRTIEPVVVREGSHEQRSYKTEAVKQSAVFRTSEPLTPHVHVGTSKQSEPLSPVKAIRSSLYSEPLTPLVCGLKQFTVQAHIVLFQESVQFDYAPTEGLFESMHDAIEDAVRKGEDPMKVEVYGFENGYLYKTDPDSSIVCLIPETEKIPVAGYISGG